MVSYELTRGVYFALWYMAAFMVMSFFLGFQIARGTLDAKLPTHSFTMAGSIAELRGVLIRSGERGLLFFDTTSKNVDFYKWDEVKHIQTVR